MILFNGSEGPNIYVRLQQDLHVPKDLRGETDVGARVQDGGRRELCDEAQLDGLVHLTQHQTVRGVRPDVHRNHALGRRTRDLTDENAERERIQENSRQGNDWKMDKRPKCPAGRTRNRRTRTMHSGQGTCPERRDMGEECSHMQFSSKCPDQRSSALGR